MKSEKECEKSYDGRHKWYVGLLKGKTVCKKCGKEKGLHIPFGTGNVDYFGEDD